MTGLYFNTVVVVLTRKIYFFFLRKTFPSARFKPLFFFGSYPNLSSKLFHISDWFPTILSICNCNPIYKNPIDGINQRFNKRSQIFFNIDPLDYSKNNQSLDIKLGEKVGFDVRTKASFRNDQYKIITGKVLFSDLVYPPEGVSTLPGAPKNGENFMQLQLKPKFKKPRKVRKKPKNVSLIRVYDLINDPTESTNLAAVKPKLTEKLLLKLKKFNKTAVPCLYPEIDKRAKPINNFWQPWQ